MGILLILLYNQVAYHDFQGLTVVDGEKEDLIKSLGTKNYLILRSHGLLTCGASIEEMFLNMTLLERSCQIQVSVDQSGRAIVPVSEEIGQKTEQLLQMQMSSTGETVIGELEFAAFQRLIDREDDSYRDI